MDIIQIIAVAFCGLALASLVRSCRPEAELYVLLAAGIILLLLILTQLHEIIDFFHDMLALFDLGDSYFPILWKVMAVAYLSDFAAQLCRDAGESSIGDKVELAGKVTIFCIAIPLMKELLRLLELLLPN